MFFCVSVAMTLSFAPVRCVSRVKSPKSWLVTVTSVIWCTALLRSTCTMRTSALPYWLPPSVIPMTNLLVSC